MSTTPRRLAAAAIAWASIVPLAGHGNPAQAATAVMAPAPTIGDTRSPSNPGTTSDMSRLISIGNGDYLVFLSPAQTKNAYNQVTRRGGRLCLTGAGLISKVLRYVNRLCSGSNAFRWAQYQRIRWFLYNASLWGGCGAFVIDGAWWRSPRLRPAQRFNYNTRRWDTFVWARPGTITSIRTATGWANITCADRPAIQRPDGGFYYPGA